MGYDVVLVVGVQYLYVYLLGVFGLEYVVGGIEVEW